MINARTRLCALLGSPVKHSFSPALHNSAFSHLDLNYVYTAFDVSPEDLGTAVKAIKALNMAGVNVTIPHKEDVLPYLDGLDRAAELNGAVNTIVNDGKKLTGYNTDGPGFTRSLREDLSFEPGGKTVLLVGAGGSARAVGMQLALEGAGVIAIMNRKKERACLLAQNIERSTGTRCVVLEWPGGTKRSENDNGRGELDSFFSSADLVVNCTPVGMSGNGNELPPLPYQLASAGQVACDLIYNPARTPFLSKLEERGCKTSNGTGMLLHQGALAFELWTGYSAPLDIMHAALLKCIE